MIHYSRGRSITDAAPAQCSCESFSKFVDALEADRAVSKANAAYICAPLSGRRSADNVQATRVVNLDLDRIDPAVLADLRLWLGGRFSGCSWPTHSSTPEEPRERVLLEVDRDVTRAEAIAICQRVANDIQDEFGDAVQVDRSTWRGEQPLFVPPEDVKISRYLDWPLDAETYLADATVVDAPPDGHNGSVLVEDGQRNDRLSRDAYRLRKLGADPSQILKILQVSNATLLRHPLTDTELQKIAAGKANITIDPGIVVPSDDSRALEYVCADALPVDDQEFDDELIEGFLGRESMAVLYGDSNSGKTFLAIDVAAAVVRGGWWMDHRVDGGMVVYLATEAAASVRMRAVAYRRRHGVTLRGLVIVQSPVNLFDSAADLSSVVELIHALERGMRMRCRMVIGDTLARIASGANENSGEDMSVVLRNADLIRSEFLCVFLWIHHFGKDQAKGMRGWSGIRAAIDTEIEISVDENENRTAEITKQRDLPGKGKRIGFRLETVLLGTNKWGSERTSCIVVSAEATEKRTRVRKVSEIAGAVMELMISCRKGMHRKDVAAYFDGRYPDKSIYREIRKLIEDGRLIEISGQVYAPKGVE